MSFVLLAAFTAVLSDPLARFPAEPAPSFAETDVPANGVVETDVVVDGLAPDVPVTLSGPDGGRWYRLVGADGGAGVAMEAVKGGTVVPNVTTAVFRWQRPATSFGRQGAFDTTLRVAQDGVTNALPFHVAVHPVQVPEAQRASFRYATTVRYDELAATAHLEPWTKAYCDRLGSYLHLAVRGRQNVVVAPAGEPAEAFLRVCEDCNIDWCREPKAEWLNPGRLPWLRRWLGRSPVCEGKDGPLPTVRLEAIRQSLEDFEMLEEVRRKDPARAKTLEGRLDALFAAERLNVVRYRALRRELLTAAVKSDFPRTRLATERHPAPEHVAAGELGVWTADSMRTVSPGVFPTREELAQPAIALQLVRNERESVQVCLTAGADRDWRGVALAVAPLCDARGCPLDGSVKWERVGYVPRRPGYFPNSCGPDPVEKWVPDPLLPAAPMRVRAGSTQGAWLTVFASPEAEPGVYTGRVDIVAETRVKASVPLVVEVSSVALPKTFSTWNSFSVMDGYTRIQYPDRTREKIRESWDIMLDHRLSPDDISRFRPADVDDLVYARSRGMNLFNVMNIVPVPDDPNTPIVYNAPAKVLFSKTFYPSFRDRIAPYVAELKRRGLGDMLYFYGFDEQEKEVYPAIAEIRRKLAADFPGIPLMSTSRAYRDMVRNPTNPPPDAAACDWFCPVVNDWNESLSADLQAKGRKVWWYTCCGPDHPFPNFGSHEHPPVEARVLLGWMTGLYRADGFLFWLVNRWNRTMSPLDESDTFLDVDTSISNRRDGDAVFLYPGKEHVLPSIRLANVRDGVEDGEIVKMLEQRDLVRADALRRTLVRSLRSFSRNPSEVRAARAEAVRTLATAAVEREMNFDESKVRPYALEDPLVHADGRKVTRASWPERRRELLDVLDRELFGREPPLPEALEVELATNEVTLAGFAVRRSYRMWFTSNRSGPCVDWTVWLPNRPSKVTNLHPSSDQHLQEGVPVVLFLHYGDEHDYWYNPASRRYVPLHAILARGYAVMTAEYEQISPDDVSRMGEGVLSLWPRTRPDEPRSLGAWAWALSRGLDLAGRIPEIDAKRSVVTGSSRLGKAALLAGARDERFAVVVPNQTGKGGVPLWKRDFGENLSMFFRKSSRSWFLPTLEKYAADETKLPFDMHYLLAAVAPRHLLVQGFATESFDPRGEFLALEAASPVWELLVGAGLPHVPYPPLYDKTATGSRLGYVRRGGPHGIVAQDWQWMLDFADAAFADVTPVASAEVLNELLPRPRTCTFLAERVQAGRLALEAASVERGAVPGVPADRQDEAYRLTAGKDGVRILAGGRRGELHARATLTQLARLAGAEGSVPAFEITDWPELPIRGVMLDTGRNFVELQALKDLIDHLALYKMNAFHWHLTDYYGWRLESKKHPGLNSDRATARMKGKFYTQAQFRELVDYAWERGVTVIPEFDVPGHTQAFRLGVGVERMREEKVRGVVLELIDELCSLVPAEKMPYVHLGTDEVGLAGKGEFEWVPKEWIAAWANRVAENGRVLWGWQPGEKIEMQGRQLKEIWGWVEYKDPAQRTDYGTVPYVDSTEFHYINHIDPFEMLNSAAFQQPCPWGPRENRRGAMISAWHDDAIAESEDYFRQVMVFPAVTMYSDAFWCGREMHKPQYFARLPPPGTADFAFAADLERRTIAQRDKVLKNLRHPFTYVAQTQMRWRLSTPDGRLVAKDIPQATVYPHRVLFKNSYIEADEGTAVVETWVKSPCDQTVQAWIGATGFARSSGRWVDGPVPAAGEWNRHGATVEVNGEKVKAPTWAHSGLMGKESREVPPVDEEYFYRPPSAIRLRAGWNHVKLTLPKPKTDFEGQKWLGTFVPVAGTSEHPREVPGLVYSSDATGR